MWFKPGSKPYVLGEIGFIVEREVAGGLSRELSARPAKAADGGVTRGMGCVEAVDSLGAAFVRVLDGEELADAKREFGFPDIEFG